MNAIAQYEQLALLDLPPTLAAEMIDRRRMPAADVAGARRLLRALIRNGLDRQALKTAALLVLGLDQEAAQHADREAA